MDSDPMLKCSRVRSSSPSTMSRTATEAAVVSILRSTCCLTPGSMDAVISRNGTRASLGPTPISSTRKVSIAPAAVSEVWSIVTNRGKARPQQPHPAGVIHRTARGPHHEDAQRDLLRTSMIFDLVLIGVAVALDPLPLTAFIILLPSRRGVLKGAAFVFGWLASLAVVVALTVLATGNSPPKPSTAPSLAALAVKMVIGAVLVGIAVWKIRTSRRPRRPKKQPKWQEHVDSMSWWFALGLGPALQPWVLAAAGAATVVEAKLSSVASYLALFFYCVLGSSSYLAIEIYSILRPERSQETLAKIRN